jgi:hypothetical protein
VLKKTKKHMVKKKSKRLLILMLLSFSGTPKEYNPGYVDLSAERSQPEIVIKGREFQTLPSRKKMLLAHIPIQADEYPYTNFFRYTFGFIRNVVVGHPPSTGFTETIVPEPISHIRRSIWSRVVDYGKAALVPYIGARGVHFVGGIVAEVFRTPTPVIGLVVPTTPIVGPLVPILTWLTPSPLSFGSGLVSGYGIRIAQSNMSPNNHSWSNVKNQQMTYYKNTASEKQSLLGDCQVENFNKDLENESRKSNETILRNELFRLSLLLKEKTIIIDKFNDLKEGLDKDVFGLGTNEKMIHRISQRCENGIRVEQLPFSHDMNSVSHRCATYYERITSDWDRWYVYSGGTIAIQLIVYKLYCFIGAYQNQNIVPAPFVPLITTGSIIGSASIPAVREIIKEVVREVIKQPGKRDRLYNSLHNFNIVDVHARAWDKMVSAGMAGAARTFSSPTVSSSPSPRQSPSTGPSPVRSQASPSSISSVKSTRTYVTPEKMKEMIETGWSQGATGPVYHCDASYSQ